MIDLIDRDKLLNSMFADDPKDFFVYIADFPYVDAVEVVRCKDCKYSKEYSDKQLDCKWFDTLVFPNGFCSNGKRREANE